MSSTIFSNSGTEVKTLKPHLSLNDVAKIRTGDDDPRVVAKEGPQGSLYLQTGASGGKLFRKLDSGSSTNWTEVGSGAGGINYITNPDAEAGTTGWSAYADAAGSVPVDGTGGSPTVTITTSSSSPLRGLNSFLLTKDAANRQGEGVSVPFTIDAADKAEVMAIEIDYAIASGTFAGGDSSDVRIFIYDVTNAQLIIPAGFTLASNTQSKFKGLWQSASNSTSYRLILHVATTSASAYVLKFDNVKVGPQTVVFGAPVTDWVDYTPVLNSNTNVSENRGRWRRVGGDMELRIEVEYGGAGDASVFYAELPVGYTMDSARIEADEHFDGGSVLGFVQFEDSGVGNKVGTVSWSTDRRLAIAVHGYSGADSQLQSSNFGAADDVCLFATVPILGWSSQLQISDDAETRVVAAAANASGVSVTGSLTDVTWTTEISDTHGALGATTFTVPVSGYYDLEALTTMNPSASTGGTGNVQINKNAAGIGQAGSNGIPTAGQNYTFGASATGYFLSPGDLITVQVSQNTGNAVTASIYLSIVRISGPTAIAANELVAARAILNGNQSVPDTNTDIIVFNSSTNGFDTHGALNLSSGRFTAPISGTYLLCATVVVSGGGATGWRIIFFKNGSAYQSTFNANSSSDHISVSVIIRLSVGDIVDCRFSNSSGGSLSVNGSNNEDAASFSVVRQGF